MSSFKPIDGSKEDFRKYLDRKGVLDAITKVLIKCNSDRPENAIEYLLDNLGERIKDKDTIARLENELNDARNEVELLKREMTALKLNADSVVSDEAGPVPEVVTQASNTDSTAVQLDECTAQPENLPSNNDTVKKTSEDAPAAAKPAENTESDPKEPAQ